MNSHSIRFALPGAAGGQAPGTPVQGTQLASMKAKLDPILTSYRSALQDGREAVRTRNVTDYRSFNKRIDDLRQTARHKRLTSADIDLADVKPQQRLDRRKDVGPRDLNRGLGREAVRTSQGTPIRDVPHHLWQTLAVSAPNEFVGHRVVVHVNNVSSIRSTSS